jgi:hypothetical protein
VVHIAALAEDYFVEDAVDHVARGRVVAGHDDLQA